MNTLLVLPILVPLLTSTATMFTRRKFRLTGWISAAGALSVFAVNLVLLSRVVTEGVVAVQAGGWLAPYGITLVADHLTAAMLAVTGLTAVATGLYGPSDGGTRDAVFHPLFHMLIAGVSGAFLAGDIFNLYVWFEVMLIASFVLLAKSGTPTALTASVKYVVMNLFSSAVFLTGIGLLYAKTGTLNMADLAVKLEGAASAPLIMSTSAFFLVAFGIKAAAFPLHFWLPASYHAPETATAAVFSGLLTKVGVYALVRTGTLIFNHDGGFPTTLITVVACLTMTVGVLGAVAQQDIRRILSFHIISQIGYMLLGLGLMTPLALAGTVFYLVHHIVVKTNLFLIGGIIAHHGGGRFHLPDLGGLYRRKPWLALLFLIPALSLAGFPPLSGFFAKFSLLKAGIEGAHWGPTVVMAVVGLLTLVSMSKIWNEAFWKPGSAETVSTPLRLWGPSALLAGTTVLIGLGAGPVFAFAETAAAQLLDPSDYIRAVLGEVAP